MGTGKFPKSNRAWLKLKYRPRTGCPIQSGGVFHRPEIDPIGFMRRPKRGSRQQCHGRINGERIDIISWSKDPVEYIKTALVRQKLLTFSSTKEIAAQKFIVNPDQRPLAIGKEGQNVRLASKLTDYELDIMDIGE